MSEHDLEPLVEDIEWALTTDSDEEIEVDLFAPLPAEPTEEQREWAEIEADPRTAARREAHEQHKADLEAGRALREEAESDAAEEALIEKYSRVGHLFSPQNRDKNGLADVEYGTWQISEKGLDALIVALDDGLDPEGLQNVLGDLYPAVSEAMQLRQERDLTNVAKELTTGHRAARAYADEELRPLNAEIADRADQWFDYLTKPDPTTGQPPMVNTVGFTDAEGRALTLASFRLADWERSEREAAEFRLQHAVAIYGDGRGDVRWYLDEHLPELAETDPVEFQKQVNYFLPKQPDADVLQGMLDPLSIPLDRALSSGVPSVVDSHIDNLGAQVEAMTGIEYDSSGSDSGIMALVAEANRQLAAEQRPSTETPDEVMRGLARRAQKSAEEEALKQFRLGRR
jgi:hypothetical protein